jgi:hypothetical protein
MRCYIKLVHMSCYIKLDHMSCDKDRYGKL